MSNYDNYNPYSPDISLYARRIAKQRELRSGYQQQMLKENTENICDNTGDSGENSQEGEDSIEDNIKDKAKKNHADCCPENIADNIIYNNTNNRLDNGSDTYSENNAIDNQGTNVGDNPTTNIGESTETNASESTETKASDNMGAKASESTEPNASDNMEPNENESAETNVNNNVNNDGSITARLLGETRGLFVIKGGKDINHSNKKNSNKDVPNIKDISSNRDVSSNRDIGYKDSINGNSGKNSSDSSNSSNSIYNNNGNNNGNGINNSKNMRNRDMDMRNRETDIRNRDMDGRNRDMDMRNREKNSHDTAGPNWQPYSSNYGENHHQSNKKSHLGLVNESMWEMEPAHQNWNVINKDSVDAMRQAYRRVNRINIAVVDENPSVLLKVKHALSPYGYDVRTFNNPSIAMMKLKETPCDLLIATGRLKYMNGIKMADFAKNTGLATHILLLLEKGDGYMLNMMRNEHINGFLLKPLSHNELIDKVSALFDMD